MRYCYKSGVPMSRRRQRGVFSDRSAGKAQLTRRIILTAVGCLTVCLTIGIIAWYQLLAYLQGDGFRNKLCSALQSITQAESVHMKNNLRIDGSTIAQSELQFKGLGNIESIGAERILAHIERGELLDRKLHIRKLTMEEGSLTIRTESKTTPLTDKEKGTQRLTPANTKMTASRGNKAVSTTPPSGRERSRFTPESFRLDFAECKDTTFILHLGKNMYSLSGCNITAQPMSNGIGWRAELENGRLHTPLSYLKDTNIKSATLLCHHDSVDLTECRIMLTPGELRARGRYDRNSEHWSAVLQLNKASVSRLLKEDWKKKLSGELFGKCILRGEQERLNSAEGSVSLRNGVLEGLPFLSELSIDNTRPYRRMELEKADCNIVFPYSAPERNLNRAWLLDKIDIRSRGNTLIIRGHVIIAEDGTLGGQLTIGIPQYIADRLPLPGERFTASLFNGRGEEGFAWVNINLSGTVDSPKEDLSVRLTTLISASLPGITLDSAGNMLQQLFNHRKNKKEEPAASEADTPVNTPAESIINGASELLNQGLRSLF